MQTLRVIRNSKLRLQRTEKYIAKCTEKDCAISLLPYTLTMQYEQQRRNCEVPPQQELKGSAPQEMLASYAQVGALGSSLH